MLAGDIPSKPRRKKIDVPVHKCSDKDNNKKTFSANFNSKKFNPENAEIVLEIPESDRSTKIRKKQLIKENLQLSSENKELLSKFHELEELSVRKITKLKEKFSALLKETEDIKAENDNLQQNYYHVLAKYEDLENNYKICTKACEELKFSSEEYKAENSKIKKYNKQLNEDINMLKVVIFRLNVQLERYQETLRKHKLNIPIYVLDEKNSFVEHTNEDIPKEIISEVHKTHKHTPIFWGTVNTHTLGPLLDAYEDTIKEKEEIIRNYEKELNNFTGRLKQIIDENEDLYYKLKEDESCSSKLMLEMENLKAELVSTKQENDALIKKCALKQDKLEEVLKVYEAKVTQLKRDFDVLHGEYIRCRTDNAALKERNTAFIEAQEDFKSQVQNYIPISVHSASVNECKKWYEELKGQYESEKQKLLKNVDLHIKKIDELKAEIAGLNGTKEKLEGKITTQEKHIKKMETKQLELEHTLNQIHLSRSALRKQLHKAMNFARDMVTEQETLLKALNQRQLENKVVKKIGSEMALRMDSLKSQLKDVQKNAWQEFSTVERTIQEQADLIETMKQDHENEIEKLTKIINRHEGTNLLLKEDNVPSPQYILFKEKYK